MNRPRSVEFSIKTREAALRRAKGICECGLCGGLPLKGKAIEFHHYKEVAANGDNSLANCRVVRTNPCHNILTAQFKKLCGKADRQRRAATGIKRPTVKIKSAGFRESTKRHRFDRTPLPPRQLYERKK